MNIPVNIFFAGRSPPSVGRTVRRMGVNRAVKNDFWISLSILLIFSLPAVYCGFTGYYLRDAGVAAEADQIDRPAFGSCAKRYGARPVRYSILRRNPQIFVLPGDTVHADTYDMKLKRQAYQKLILDEDRIIRKVSR